ncbi:hypothetical protein V1527DRAFT_498343 [Lipomyces starkeyi]
MSTQQRIREDVNRKWRTHRKSRVGCRNCKLRRVKCDETRPQCKNCTSFGDSCNYDLNVADLQLSISGTASINLHGMTKSPAFLFPVIISDNEATFQLDRQCLDRLGRFQVRTVHSIKTARVAQFYQNEVIRLAYLHPYLIHGTRAEVYHFSLAAALFNRKLSTPLQPSDRDALSATAALLGVIAFSCLETSTPEEAWPLKTPAHSDLQWLKMVEGKNTIWKVADPLRLNSSVFRALDHDLSFPASTSSGIENIPSAFIQIYVSKIPPLLHIECVQSIIPRFLSMLLEQKDSRALVLLAYWYAKVCHLQWWIARRALLEYQAICLYMEKHHAGDTATQELVQFPKMRCKLFA